MNSFFMVWLVLCSITSTSREKCSQWLFVKNAPGEGRVWFTDQNWMMMMIMKNRALVYFCAIVLSYVGITEVHQIETSGRLT